MTDAQILEHWDKEVPVVSPTMELALIEGELRGLAESLGARACFADPLDFNREDLVWYATEIRTQTERLRRVRYEIRDARNR